MPDVAPAEVLWRPSPERVERARLTRFAGAGAPSGTGSRCSRTRRATRRCGAGRSSTSRTSGRLVWEHFDVLASPPPEQVLTTREMPGARWFLGARLNLAEHVLRTPRRASARSSPPARRAARRGDVGRAARPGRRAAGGAARARRRRGRPRRRLPAQRAGDRRGLPGLRRARRRLVGVRARHRRLERRRPLRPARAVGARHRRRLPLRRQGPRPARRGRRAARRPADGHRRRRACPQLGHGVERDGRGGASRWDDAVAEPREPELVQVDAEHPLWVVYSSGTTGLPKGLVHSHAGALLMGLVQVGLQYDVDASRPLLLVHHAELDHVERRGLGPRGRRHGGALRRQPAVAVARPALAAGRGRPLTRLGTSPGYLLACEKAGLDPAREHDLSALRAVGSTGSPLPASSFRWVYEHVGADLALHVISGGTDFAAALLLDAPWLPVTAGEMSCRGLGLDVESWDEQGHAAARRGRRAGRLLAHAVDARAHLGRRVGRAPARRLLRRLPRRAGGTATG